MSKKEDKKDMANGFHITAVKNYNTHSLVWVILVKYLFSLLAPIPVWLTQWKLKLTSL